MMGAQYSRADPIIFWIMGALLIDTGVSLLRRYTNDVGSDGGNMLPHWLPTSIRGGRHAHT